MKPKLLKRKRTSVKNSTASKLQSKVQREGAFTIIGNVTCIETNTGLDIRGGTLFARTLLVVNKKVRGGTNNKISNRAGEVVLKIFEREATCHQNQTKGR